jgi:acyl-CoA synthetase (AMP-forming)/AMP-acid ligase II
VVNPFFHSFGYKAGIVVSLLTGATVVPMVVFDATGLMRLVEEHGVTVLPGAPTADFEVRIVGADGADLPAGESGEIQLRGPNLMLGYLDDPEATAEAVDAEGWLHTGDVGKVDEAGYLTITDRLKDVFIVGGFNVYPAEVEQVLARLDGVVESAVVGVPDDRLGEVGKAFVVRRSGATLDSDAVVQYLKERLANFKVPRHVEIVDALPRNLAGKVLKTALREGRGDA